MDLEFKHLGIIGLAAFIGYLVKVRKPSTYGLLFSLLCVYIPISGKYPFTFGSGLNVINAFYLVLFVIGLKRSVKRQNDGIWTVGILWGGVCVFALVVAAIGNPEELGTQVVHLRRLLDPLIIYYFARRLSSESDRWVAIEGVAVGTFLFSAHLLFQGLDMGHKIRVGGFFAQANEAAAFVAAYCPILLAMFIMDKRNSAKILFLALVAICCFAQMQTVSRGGIIGMALGLVMTALFSRQVLLKFSVLAVILFVLVSPSLLPEKVLERFEGGSMSGVEGDREAEASAESRYEIWRGSFSMIVSNPLGVGLGGFIRNIRNYIPRGRDAHNIFLRVWGEMGTQGVVIFTILLVQFIRRGRQATGMLEDDISQIAGLAIIGGMAALCFTNLFSTTMLDSLIFNYMWILAAVSVRKPPEDDELILAGDTFRPKPAM